MQNQPKAFFSESRVNVPARLASYVNAHLVIGVSVIVMTVHVEGKLEIRNKGTAHGNVRRLCTGVHSAVYFGIGDTARAKEWWLRTGLDGAAYVRILDTGVEKNNGCAQGYTRWLTPETGRRRVEKTDDSVSCTQREEISDGCVQEYARRLASES